jgi:hypothetical protein
MAKLITLPGPPPRGRSCYVEAAPETEVLFDQLAFLLEHVSPSCPLECRARLAKVTSLLLASFQAPIQTLAQPGQIAE